MRYLVVVSVKWWHVVVAHNVLSMIWVFRADGDDVVLCMVPSPTRDSIPLTRYLNRPTAFSLASLLALRLQNTTAWSHLNTLMIRLMFM